MGAGRKPKPASEKQSRLVMVSLTPDEHRGLREAASDEPIGTYVRRLIQRHLARRRK